MLPSPLARNQEVDPTAQVPVDAYDGVRRHASVGAAKARPTPVMRRAIVEFRRERDNGDGRCDPGVLVSAPQEAVRFRLGHQGPRVGELHACFVTWIEAT